MPARVEKIAREQLQMQLPAPGRDRNRRSGTAMRAAHHVRQRRRVAPTLPRLRAPLVFGGLLAAVRGLARPLALSAAHRQRVSAGAGQLALQPRASRYPRIAAASSTASAIRSRSARRSRRCGRGPTRSRRRPTSCARSPRRWKCPPPRSTQKLAQGGDFVYLKKPVAPEVADRAAALKIKGMHDENEYWRYYPGGEVMSHIVGFTGDHDVGQEGIELAQQIVARRQAGQPPRDHQSPRRDRRGRREHSRAAGRPRSRAVDRQPAAVPRLPRAQGRGRGEQGEGGRARHARSRKTGEILALANWPTYNPNNRNRVARDKMRNRALIDTFEPGSTLKPFTIAAALDSGKVSSRDRSSRPRPGTLTDRPRDDPRRASRRRADGRAGDPEIVERRRREDRAVAAAGNDVADALRRRLRHAAEDRLSRRSVGPAAAGEDLAADRAGDDGLRPRHLGQSRAARARVHDLRDRRRVEAGDAAQGRRRRSPAGRCCSRRPRARCGTCWRWSCSPAAPRRRRRSPAIASPARPAPRTSSRTASTSNKYVSSFVGFAPASDPRLVVAVMIDEPGSGEYYGGAVAAPVFAA